MRQDEYGAAIEQALRDATGPLTAAELRQLVGCSRQRVYTWLQANENKVRPAGKDRAGGNTFVWDTKVRRLDTDPGQTDSLQVKSFFVESGEIVLVLVGPDGSTYHARPAM